MSRTPAIPPMSDPIEASPRRELYLFAMYRVMEAGILAFLAFSPLAGIISAPDRPALARAAGAGYIALALLLWLASRLRSMSLRRQAALGLIEIGRAHV